MSVILYKNNGDSTATIAGDKMAVLKQSGLKLNSKKVFKIGNIIVGHCGESNVIEKIINTLKNVAQEKIMSYEGIKSIFYSVISENDINNEFLLYNGNNVYDIIIGDGKDISIVDITNFDYFGIGYFEMPIGAMIGGLSPSEAIKSCSKYNLYFNDEVDEFTFNISK